MKRRLDIGDFGLDEFACGCGCGEKRISLELVKKLQAARTIAGIPFIIASGARCEDHNRKVGGSPESEHVPAYMPDNHAHGVDIDTDHPRLHRMGISNSRARHLILDALRKAGFTRIGIMRGAIHAGDGETVGAKDPDVTWDYY